MFHGVSRRPGRIRTYRGKSIPAFPLGNLSHRILAHSAQGHSVKISFEPQGIRFNPTGDIVPYSERLSRNIFKTKSITSVTFKSRIDYSEEKIIRILDFLRTGNTKNIMGLIEDIEILPPISQLLKEGRPLANLPIRLGKIPGTFKHYTDHEGYQRIAEQQMIRAQSYEGRASRVCLTTLSLNPEEVWEKFFISSPVYANHGRGDYVFGFDLKGIRPENIQEPFPGEYWLRDNIRFGRNADLRFAGMNPMG